MTTDDTPIRRPIRTVIVDDEPLGRDCVREVLGREPDVDIVGECPDGASACTAISRLRPDLVVLDVQMPGISGLEVVAAIGPDEMPITIFVTAYDVHAVRAFEAQALDYVLKPFEDDRLLAALDRARAMLAMRESAQFGSRLRTMLESAAAPAGAPVPVGARRLMVRTPDSVVPVAVAEIDLIESDGNYVVIHTPRARHRFRSTLSAMAAQLDPSQFARVHKRTILNLDRVREIQPWFGGDHVALLHDGRKVRVSRTYAPAVLAPFR